MHVLGIESSCDETGVALFDSQNGSLVQAVHSQAEMHRDYGGVVPELASRDHVRRVLPLLDSVLGGAGCGLEAIDAVAVTAGPGLAGALLVGCGIATALAYALQRPLVAVHHLEGHLLSPLLTRPAPEFPFVSLLVSGGHTQLLEVRAAGRYRLLGETLDDAAGEAFDKAAQILGLGYPGGPTVSAMALTGRPGAIALPRPMLTSGDLNMSFSGLKTAVLTAARRPGADTSQARADLARAFVDAVVAVLSAKAMAALAQTGLRRLVVAGGVGANVQLRAGLAAASAARKATVYYPPAELCTDNGAMIAYAGYIRLTELGASQTPLSAAAAMGYSAAALRVRPRWNLCDLDA